MTEDPRPVVLHAACHPVTGPWSVMRDLARAQVASGRFAGVGIAVVADRTWPAHYRQELGDAPVAFYKSSCPRLFGTAAFLYQRLRPPAWRDWVGDLAARARASRVVVHFHNAWMSGVFLPLPAIPGLRIGAVATVHGVNEHFQGKPVRLLVHRWMARRLLTWNAALTSVDGRNTAVAERLFGLPAKAFAVIPNGLTPCAAEAGPALRDPRLPLTIGHVGSMIPQKGWRLLAAAAERLNHDAVRVRVVLAGAGPDEQAATEWARRHAMWARYLGHVSNPRENVMTQLDVLCLMSQWEGLPMSILEAMSVGLPVIATDVGGVSEAVRHQETGLLIPRTAEDLADALSGLLRERERLAAMGARARAFFLERFTLDHVVARYADVYREALA